MSRGTHIVRRGRAALSTSAGLSPTTREPLLFLYPQWIRNSTTGAREVPSGGDSHLSSNAHILGRDSANENAHRKSTRCKKLSENELESPPLIQPVLRPSPRQAQSRNGPTNDQTRRLPENDRVTTENPGGEANSGFFRPTDVVRRILISDWRRSSRKAYKQLVMEEYEERKVAERKGVVSNWREVLDGLKRHTPDGTDYGHDHVLKIKVPFSAVGRFLFDEEDNIWSIKRRYGCQIEISDADKANQGRRVALLSGSPRSVHQAAMETLRVTRGAIADEEIRAFSGKLGEQRPTVLTDGPSTSKVRFILAELRRKKTRPVNADTVTRPPIWTPDSFGLYIEELTCIKTSTHMQRILYKPGENHTDAVVDILKTVFLQPECRTAISVEAFNDALAYLVKCNAIHVVRDLFVHMDLQGLKMNTATFNIMLRGTAKSQSIGNFYYIFRLMIRRGYTPDPDTWLAFMRVPDDPRIKLHILKVMKSKELLHDPKIRQGVCMNLIEMDINNFLDNQIPLGQFLAHMENYYGQAWLTRSCANRILDALGSKGLMSRCWEFIEFMHTKNVKLDNVSILTVLHHCERQDNPQAAVEIIRRISSLFFFNPDQNTYHSLFNIAWTARLQCVARVVWHYACLNAATTYVMRRRISRGALGAIPSSSHPHTLKFRARKEWAALACRFILGIPIPLHDQHGSPIPEDSNHDISPSLHHTTTQASTNPCEENLHWSDQKINLAEDDINQSEENVNAAKQITTPDGEYSNTAEADSNPDEPNQNRAAVRAAFTEQFLAHRTWEAQRPFADVLVEAFETDWEWASSGGSLKDERLEWLSWKMPLIPLRIKARRQMKE